MFFIGSLQKALVGLLPFMGVRLQKIILRWEIGVTANETNNGNLQNRSAGRQAGFLRIRDRHLVLSPLITRMAGPLPSFLAYFNNVPITDL